MGRVALRVVHTPLNVAGIPWTNVQALRRRGVDAKLVVVERQKLHPEADVSLDRPRGFWGRQAVQWPAFVRLLPQTDVFHFYFGWTLVPRKLTWPILKAARRRSVLHFLGSDIRGKPPEQLRYASGADARIVGSYDARRWMPDAHVVPPGVDVREYAVPPLDERDRPVVLHAPSSRGRKGTEHVVDACEGLGVELDIVEGLRHDEARRRYERADIVVDQLNAGWYGIFALEAMALGKPVLSYLRAEAVEETERALGVEVPVVPVTKETLRDRIAELAHDAERRRAVGAASRAYVERVHDADDGAERLLEIYRAL
ncbi:MAG: glycosyltransferase [Actinomycetota bacterium]|nr:glycosyltransferase [Actinomycetota bacterium]